MTPDTPSPPTPYSTALAAMNTAPREPAQVLSCRTPADFLAALPRLFGFDPEDSLVVLRFSGTRSVEAARIDLPAEPSPEGIVHALTMLRTVLTSLSDMTPGRLAQASQPITGLGLAILTSAQFGNSLEPPWAELARHITRDCRDAEIEITALCCRAADGWGDYLEPNPGPVGGRPRRELSATPIALDAAVRGEVSPSQSEYGMIPEPDARRAARVAAVFAPELAAGSAPNALTARAERDPGAASRGAVPRDVIPQVLTTATALRTSRALSLDEAACVIRTLSDPGRWLGVVFGIMLRPVRAGVMLREADTGAQFRTILQPEPAAVDIPLPRLLALLADVGIAFTERACLVTVRERLREMLAECPPPIRAPLYALSAWAWWLSGIQSVAQQHVDAGLELAPDNALLRTIAELIVVPSHVSRFAPAAAARTWSELGEAAEVRDAE
ncbi:hypothetical protein FM113_00335 [Leucobacter sp. 7(1)]|uniref:DUF4192 family protein n=1 Tax=Leucobacter sp. 7(1) TaxID=1255613 RepID=UPI00097F1DE2|nr:DUF4192 family protein [Leucobacter sp. 7(1)]SJN07991.1 hypothetical protein FM113_00335 [Leucobacter sp. 7(1)]